MAACNMVCKELQNRISTVQDSVTAYNIQYTSCSSEIHS